MVAEIEAAAKVGDSLGGVVEVLGYGVAPGLGSHVHWDRKIDGLLAQALMSIQAMKGVEIGDGFEVAGRRGSEAHDEILWDDVDEPATRAASTRAGGTEGGMTTGDLLVARVAMKPLATLNRPVLRTVDVGTKEETVSFKERTDVTAVPASGVVAETMVALVLASEALRKFGGDSLDEFVRNHEAYLASLDVSAPREDVHVSRHLVLVGLMGAGKTTVGEVCASRLGRPFVDTDDVVEATTGRVIAEIFATDGEAAFREAERRAVADVCASPEPLVIACGGGAVARPREPPAPPGGRLRGVAARASPKSSRNGSGATP